MLTVRADTVKSYLIVILFKTHNNIEKTADKLMLLIRAASINIIAFNIND